MTDADRDNQSTSLHQHQAKAPLDQCPKCGGNFGSPRYERAQFKYTTSEGIKTKTLVREEHLDYSCLACGFSIFGPTLNPPLREDAQALSAS